MPAEQTKLNASSIFLTPHPKYLLLEQDTNLSHKKKPPGGGLAFLNKISPELTEDAYKTFLDLKSCIRSPILEDIAERTASESVFPIAFGEALCVLIVFL